MAKMKKVSRKKKTAAKKTGSHRSQLASKKKSARKKRKKMVARPSTRALTKKNVRITRGAAPIEELAVASFGRRGLGARSAGQSGDTQGLSRAEGADSESVQELVEEGQDFEAGIVAGVEEADDNEGEVHTKQVLEDDVPLEYLDKD